MRGSSICGSMSPDGSVGCMKLAGHQLEASPSCFNASTGQRWCGYCATWDCAQHQVVGCPLSFQRLLNLMGTAEKED